jgi:tetratricopeptide (TPR) repeat protein
VKQFPDVPEYQENLVRANLEPGMILGRQKNYAKSEACYRRTIELLEGLPAEWAAKAETRWRLGRAEYCLGVNLESTGQLTLAEQSYARAVAFLEPLTGSALAETPPYHQDLGHALVNLGLHRAQAKKAAEAEALFRRAEPHLTLLATRWPSAVTHHEAGVICFNLGMALLRGGKAAEARPLAERGFRHAQAARMAAPFNAEYSAWLLRHVGGLAELYRQLGDHAALARHIDQAVRVAPAHKDTTFDAATELARAVALARADTRLTDSVRGVLVESYGKRAVDYLQRAVAQGYRDLQILEKDARLAPVRDRADFQALLGQLRERKTSASPGS